MSTASERVFKEIQLKNEKEYKLEIWDTIGQEKYRATNKIFMKNAKITLLVYSIIDQNSFDNLSDFYNQICECNGKDIILGVIGNKSDLYEKREIKEEKGKEYAKSINALFFESSAKDHDSIEKIFQTMIEEYDKKYDEKIKEIESINENQLTGSFKLKKRKRK